MGFTNPIGELQLAPGATVNIDNAPTVLVPETVVAVVRSFGFFDISGLSSIDCQASNSTVQLTFFAAANPAAPQPSEIVAQETFTAGRAGQPSFFSLPCRGNTLLVDVTPFGLGGTIALSGSQRDVPKPTAQIVGGDTPAGWNIAPTIVDLYDNEFAFSAQLAAGATSSVHPSFRSGPVQLTVGSGGTAVVTVSTDAAGQILPQLVLTAGASQTVEFIAPRKPILVAVTSTSGAAHTVTLDLISQD
jgi:hypothetical protein